MMRMHVRAPTGTRIEQTERVVDDIERAIRQMVPRDELDGSATTSGCAICLHTGLLSDRQRRSAGRRHLDRAQAQASSDRRLSANKSAQLVRAQLSRTSQVYFQAADIVSQVLNFGLSAPIDVQISGSRIWTPTIEVARRLETRWRAIPGLD